MISRRLLPALLLLVLPLLTAGAAPHASVTGGGFEVAKSLSDGSLHVAQPVLPAVSGGAVIAEIGTSQVLRTPTRSTRLPCDGGPAALAALLTHSVLCEHPGHAHAVRIRGLTLPTTSGTPPPTSSSQR